jgi:hypothetical protein
MDPMGRAPGEAQKIRLPQQCHRHQKQAETAKENKRFHTSRAAQK